MARSFVVAVVAAAVLVSPAAAVIKVLTPLSGVLKDVQFVFVAEVDKVDPAKPSVVFKHVEDLKGKAPAERIPMLLTGDTFAKKDDHTKVMLDRLAPGRKLVVFVNKRDDILVAFAFMEGTWFQMEGAIDPDGKTIRWSFLHCEPYFRRTFKGTTDELKAVVKDAIAGKKEPPAPDEKEPHGYGPPVEKKKEEPKKEPQASGGRQPPVSSAQQGADAPRSPRVIFASVPPLFEPIFGVIPSSVLLGPLAILAAIFPGTFGGLMSGMDRWRALLVVVSVNSLLAAAYFFLAKYKLMPDYWWSGLPALSVALLSITLAGIIWAGRRYRAAAAEDPAVTDPPNQRDVVGLAGVTAGIGVMLVVIGWWFGWAELFKNPGREFTASFVGLVAATGYSLYRWLAPKAEPEVEPPPTFQMSAPGEAVALAVIFAFGLVMLTATVSEGTGATGPAAVEATAGTEATKLKLTDAELLFETDAMDKVMSGVCVTPTRLYVGGMKTAAFGQYGVVVCVDRATGKQLWTFDSSKLPAEWKKESRNARELRTVYSTPVEANGKLYFGEGLHTDPECRLFCLDAETGKPLWKKSTTSHTEGNPVVADGRVIFSAGDEGLICVTADTGADVWRYPAGEHTVHIDTSVVVAKGRVYAGSGYNTFAAFCLDAATGKEVWRKELPLRSFGTPLVHGEFAYYGLGTGNLSEDLSGEDEPGKPKEKEPAGRVTCLDAATGEEVWSLPLPRSVHTQLAGDARNVYAAGRDGWLYAIDKATGKQSWRASSGLPIVAGPVAATYSKTRIPFAVYLAGPSGQVTAHDPLTGATLWGRGIPELVGRKSEVQSPPLLIQSGKARRELFVPVTLTNRNNGETKAAVVGFVDVNE